MEDVVARNRTRQIEWYGEPLGDRFRRLLDRLGLSQAGLAEVLGLSAPMLSQLMSGHRAKISNPVVVTRLHAVEELAADPAAGRLGRAELLDRLDRIRAEAPSTTSELRVASADPAADLQALLRSVASAAEIEAAAALLDRDFPDLADLLRVYGNGRTADARAHFARALRRP